MKVICTALCCFSILCGTIYPAYGSRFEEHFGHLRGSSYRDFFTQRPTESQLAQVHRLLIALNKGRKTLDQVTRELPMGVSIQLETDSVRQVVKEDIQFMDKLHPNNIHTPPELQGRWVLFIENNRIIGEFIEALIQNVPLYDFLFSNQLFRLVLKGETRNVSTHIVFASREQQQPKSGEVAGLISFSSRTFRPPNDHLMIAPRELGRGHFFDVNSQTTLFRQLLMAFWHGEDKGFDRESVQELRSTSLAVLGFKNVNSMILSEFFGPHQFVHYAYLLGAMGYRFNPGSPNTGHFSFLETPEKRKQYLEFLAQSALVTGYAPQLTKGVVEQFAAHYERAAAALKILGDRDALPPHRYIGETPKYKVLSGLARFGSLERDEVYADPNTPFHRLLLMVDAIEKAEAEYPRELKDMMTEGRRKNWDFSAAELTCEQVLDREQAKPKRKRWVY